MIKKILMGLCISLTLSLCCKTMQRRTPLISEVHLMEQGRFMHYFGKIVFDALKDKAQNKHRVDIIEVLPILQQQLVKFPGYKDADILNIFLLEKGTGEKEVLRPFFALIKNKSYITFDPQEIFALIPEGNQLKRNLHLFEVVV